MSPEADPDTSARLHVPKPVQVSAPLLKWYDENGRKLPWRDIGDPYRILVSEIMLQQTRVSTVLNYYPAFIERFPDAEKLAAASEEAVLAMGRAAIAGLDEALDPFDAIAGTPD